MNLTSSMLLIGIGGAGSAIARGVNRAFGGEMRHLLVDTDASTGRETDPFVLIGGDRLSGRGSGGDIVTARMAAEDSLSSLNDRLDGVRLAVIVTALGGGTGGGAALEIVKHLAERGLPTLVFATTPFSFESDQRQRNARGIMSMIEDTASSTFFLPLDKLVTGIDNMEEAMHRAIDTIATGVTFFWRIVEKPGYLRMDAERIRHLISAAGRGRFAAISVQGENRAANAVEELINSGILTAEANPVRKILCGILAGDDLRLSEVGTVANGIRDAFGGGSITPEVATVNDESVFSGRLAVVVMLFESAEAQTVASKLPGRKKTKSVLDVGPTGKGRFNNAERTEWRGEDLDIPTYLRQNINLDLL